MAQDITDIVEIPSRQLSKQEYRDWICDIESQLQAVDGAVDRHNCESAGFEIVNTITDGLYTRELRMPKGSLVTSRIHIKEHPFIVISGKVSVYDGESVTIIEAPFKGVTKPGTKRILYVHEDTVWITFHPTKKKTMEEIDKSGVITCDNFEQFDEIEAGEICLG